MALSEHIATDEICINEMNILHISRANSAREHECTPGTINNRLCQYLHSKLALWYLFNDKSHTISGNVMPQIQ